MLAVSLVINFILICLVMYYMDKVKLLTKSLEKTASARLFGGKTAWHQYHYVLFTYVDLLKCLNEYKQAFASLFMDFKMKEPITNTSVPEILKDYYEKHIFTQDWTKRNFPVYGVPEIIKLSDEYHKIVTKLERDE